MLWAIASSVFVIYLYRKLNAANVPLSGPSTADAAESELAALNAQIAKLESKLAKAANEGVKP